MRLFSQTCDKDVTYIGIWWRRDYLWDDLLSSGRISGQVWPKSVPENSYHERGFAQLSGAALCGGVAGTKKCLQDWTQAGFHSFKEMRL